VVPGVTDTQCVRPGVSLASAIQLLTIASTMKQADANSEMPIAAQEPARVSRRTYAQQFKRKVVAQCLAPGASVSAAHEPGRDDFRRGDKVSFTDKYLQPQVGTISRINQRTAPVDCEGGSTWRLPFAMLRHGMDI
jgi:hypothetical protein